MLWAGCSCDKSKNDATESAAPILLVMKKSDWPILHETERVSNYSYTFLKEVSSFQTFSMGSLPGRH